MIVPPHGQPAKAAAPVTNPAPSVETPPPPAAPPPPQVAQHPAKPARPHGDATPAPMRLPSPGAVASATAPRPAAAASPANAEADKRPAGTMDALAKRFNVDLAKLPQAEQDKLREAFQRFARVGATPADANTFLRTLGTSLTHDRKRIIGAIAANPREAMVRLAPTITREAKLLEAFQAAMTVKTKPVALEYMRQAIIRNGLRPNASDNIYSVSQSDLREPKAWAAFRDRYFASQGGEERARKAGRGDEEAHPSPEKTAMRYIEAMDLLSRPGAGGQTPLQRSAPEALAANVQAQLAALAHEHPEIQAYTPAQIRQIAGAFSDGVKATPVMSKEGVMTVDTSFTDAGGHTFDLAHPPPVASEERAAYDAMVRDHMERKDIPVFPSLSAPAMAPFHTTSALAVLEGATNETMRGLSVAEAKLASNDLAASDILPLASQVQGAMADELAARLDSGAAIDGVMYGTRVLNAQVAEANRELAHEKAEKIGTAIVGGIAGIGLVASGPLGWGVGVTAGLATAAGAAGVGQAYFDWKDYERQLRAGGIDHAGLAMSNLEDGDWRALAANLTLNAAGVAGGGGAIANAARIEKAAARLKYTGQLIEAMSATADARPTAIQKFLASTGITGEHATAIAADVGAMKPEQLAVATRLLERFGPDTTNPQVLRAILRFAVTNADITNAAGAVANVDHMYAAYLAMNNIAQQQLGRTLTDGEKTVNMISTIGTDAQGKFGHSTLAIIPTTLPDGRTITTTAEHLLEIRRQAYEAIFDGAPASMDAWRERFVRELVDEPDGMKRMASFGKLLASAKEDPAFFKRLQEHMLQTGLQMRLMPFTEGAYIHNVVDPTRIYAMAREAGLSQEQAGEAAYRAQMHGFGNAFVGGAYPAIPDFGGVMIPGTKTPLFTKSQLEHLNRVGRESLTWNKEIQPTVAQAAQWGIATNPPPRGANQIFVAAMRANNGELPPGLQQWLTEQGAAFRAVKKAAGLGASATEADNLGNYVDAGMRKWAGIFAHNPSMGAADRVGDQLDRLRYGLNAYAVEEGTVGDIAAFGHNFAGPAERLGLYRRPGSITYAWVMNRTADGRFVVDTSEAAAPYVRKAAAAVRARFPQINGATPAQVLESFYGGHEADMKTALAELAEGDLPPAFDRSRTFTGPIDRRLQPLTQLLLFQQTGHWVSRAYNAW